MTKIIRKELSERGRVVQLSEEREPYNPLAKPVWIVQVWAPTREGGQDTFKAVSTSFQWAEEVYCKAVRDAAEASC